jgi:hypothetical protein
MKIGTEGDERCNRTNDDGFACDGTMQYPESAPACYCHGDNGPCYPCQNMLAICDVCEKSGDED